MPDLDIKVVPQLDKRLGRQKVHDENSRGFPARVEVDKTTWRDRSIRIIDPLINPNQCHGECTGCAKSMQLNTFGNRVLGKVLNMNDAHNLYTYASSIDPWEGAWPPDDTGSSGLASAKAAQHFGLGGEYRHIFGGADEVVQNIMASLTVSIGTWWKADMFEPDSYNVIEPTGDQVGGHQYLAKGYILKKDLVTIRCWWGKYRDVHIKREHLNDLIMQDGDAHIQERVG